LKNTIVIADDHPLMLRGLSDFLTSKGYNIVGSASDGKSAYNLIVKEKPEIAILDIRMPYKTGLEIAEDCKKNNIDTKIILITFDKEESLYDKALELGIYGYILKEFAIEEIENCINNVVNNKAYFSEEITTHLKLGSNQDALDLLTKTEKNIVSLIAKNYNSVEIADELCVSIRTVDKHRSNIMSKLNLESKPASLTIWASLNKNLFQ